MATVVELPIDAYVGPVDPDWCPGCGDFAVLKAVKTGVGKLGIPPKDLLIVSGIGCSSNLPGYVHAYGVHSLHGRAVPVATGARLANTDLNVVITGGDGDGYGIGLGHIIHAMRRNLNLTYVVMNNQIYGLTTGQASPTTMKEMRTKSTPGGNPGAPHQPNRTDPCLGGHLHRPGLFGRSQTHGPADRRRCRPQGFLFGRRL